MDFGRKVPVPSWLEVLAEAVACHPDRHVAHCQDDTAVGADVFDSLVNTAASMVQEIAWEHTNDSGCCKRKLRLHGNR